MIAWQAAEGVATAFNIGSNLFMLHKMMENPLQRVPIGVVCMQMAGNLAWMSSALLRGDPYLFATASSSLVVQATTATILTRARGARRRPVATDSAEELPSLPPKR